MTQNSDSAPVSEDAALHREFHDEATGAEIDTHLRGWHGVEPKVASFLQHAKLHEVEGWAGHR